MTSSYDIVVPELHPAKGFPMPGTVVHDQIVVASVHLVEDDNYQPIEALVITLDPASDSGFYRVLVLTLKGYTDPVDGHGEPEYTVLWAMKFYNIVEATNCYQENGGDL